MTWTTDGSGLQVKRIRGRTIQQSIAELDWYRREGITIERIRQARRWTGVSAHALSDRHLLELRSKRRSLAKRQEARREERIARRYRKWDRYSLSPKTPRRTERRWMRKALEGAARTMGLEPRPGEFSRDLRARTRHAFLFSLSGEKAHRLWERLERMPRDIMTRNFLQDMEPPLRDTFAEALGLKVTETPDAIMAHYPSEGGTVDGLKTEMDRMLGKTSISEPFEVPASWDRATLRIGGGTLELSADGSMDGQNWISLERIPGVTYPIEALPMELSDEEYKRRALEVVKRRTVVPPKAR